MFIIDESSIIKNTTSDIYKNTKAILKYHERKILLNATPLEQNVLEFYNQLDLLVDIEIPLSKVLGKMEFTGMKIDREELNKQKSFLESLMKHCLPHFHVLILEPIKRS